jgi:hypothetical protein
MGFCGWNVTMRRIMGNKFDFFDLKMVTGVFPLHAIIVAIVCSVN